MHSSKRPNKDFIEINITSDLIDFVILGPTFSDKEAEAIQKIKDAKLNYNKLSKKQSIGTGIIQMN